MRTFGTTFLKGTDKTGRVLPDGVGEYTLARVQIKQSFSCTQSAIRHIEYITQRKFPAMGNQTVLIQHHFPFISQVFLFTASNLTLYFVIRLYGDLLHCNPCLPLRVFSASGA